MRCSNFYLLSYIIIGTYIPIRILYGIRNIMVIPTYIGKSAARHISACCVAKRDNGIRVGMRDGEVGVGSRSGGGGL